MSCAVKLKLKSIYEHLWSYYFCLHACLELPLGGPVKYFEVKLNDIKFHFPDIMEIKGWHSFYFREATNDYFHIRKTDSLSQHYLHYSVSGLVHWMLEKQWKWSFQFQKVDIFECLVKTKRYPINLRLKSEKFAAIHIWEAETSESFVFCLNNSLVW